MEPQWMGLNRNAMLAAAAIAGVWIGLFSNIPVIACLNCLLFAWVWIGGILAVYLYRRSEHEPYLTVTQGMLLGLLAGVIGALIGVVVLSIWHGPVTIITNTLRDFAGRRTGALTDFFFASSFSVLRLLRDLLIYGVMGAVGGFIATGILWKRPKEEKEV